MKISKMINQLFSKRNEGDETFRYILALFFENLGEQLFNNTYYNSLTISNMEEHFKNDYFQFEHKGKIYDLRGYYEKRETLLAISAAEKEDFQTECKLVISKENYEKRKLEFRRLGSEFRKEGFGVKLKFNSGFKRVKNKQNPCWSMTLRIDDIDIE